MSAGLNTTVRVLDLGILPVPTLAGTWTGPTAAIDHNGFAKGNRYYLSNYSAGLTVLDISNPGSPERVGFFDTYPTSNATAFVGAWGAYPFLASGTIAVSDINSGLYLLENETLGSPNGSLAVTTPLVEGAEGQIVDIAVGRTNGATGAVSVDLELLLVRLKNPQGGATLGYPDTIHLRIFEPGAPTRLRLLDETIDVDEARGEAVVVATRHGSTAGEARVRVRTLAGSYDGFTPVDTELVWADGDSQAKLVPVGIDAGALSAGQSASFQVELYSPTAVTLEDASGDNAASLSATIAVQDNTSPPPPPAPPPAPPPPPASGGGGGAFDWFWLMAMLLALHRSRPSVLLVERR